MMFCMRDRPKRRQPYQRPLVRRIRIVPDELAATGCQTRTSTTVPTVGCFRANCRSIGS